MIYLVSLFCALGASGVFFLVHLIHDRKKEKVGALFCLFEALPDLIGSSILGLLFALAIDLCFVHYRLSNLVPFFAFESLLCAWLRPHERVFVALRQKKNPFTPEASPRFWRDLSLLTALLLEVFAFHTSSYGNKSQESVASLSYVSGNEQAAGTTSASLDYAGSVEIKDIPKDETYFFLDFAPENLAVQVRYRVKESGESAKDWLDFSNYTINLAYPEDAYLPFWNKEKIQTDTFDLQVVVFYSTAEQASPHPLKLNAVRLGAPVYFMISYLRLFLLTGAIFLLFDAPRFLVKRKGADALLEKKKRWSPFQKSLLVAGCLSLSALAVFLAISFRYSGRYFTSYPLDSSLLPTSGDGYYYYHLFDAIQHGQFALRVTPDSKLVALANPYSIRERNAAGAKYLWDCAYYQGHYYCYFGIGPLLFVMYPVYFLSGGNYLPTGAFVLQFAIVVLAIEFLFLGILFNKMMGERISYPIAGVLGLLGFFAGAFPLMFKDNMTDWQYWVAMNWGVTSLIGFLGLTLSAYAFPKTRTALFPCIGLSYVMILLSRPDLCFSVLVLAPLFFKMMFDHDVRVSHRVIQFVSMFFLLGVGFAFAFYYNYARFGRIFEFGSSYQLTVMDQTNLHLTWKGIWAGAFAFLLEPWGIDGSYPFLVSQEIVTPISYHDYTLGTVGLFTNLFSWVILVIPFTLKGLPWEKKTAYIAFFPVLLLYAGLVYSYSGSCPRYCLSFWMIGSFLSLLTFFRLFDRASSHPFVAANLFRAAVFSAFFAGFIGLFLPLSGYSNGRFGYSGLYGGQMWGYPEMIRRMMGTWFI